MSPEPTPKKSRDPFSKKQRKDITISIRVTAEEDKILSLLSEQLDMNKSEIIRRGIGNFVLFTHSFKKVIIANDYLKVLFEHASREALEEMAKTAFEYSIGDSEIDKHFINPDKDSRTTQFIYHLKSLSTRVYSPEGQNWFDEVDYKVQQEGVIFYGSHQLGKNFSIFIRNVLIRYANHFGFQIHKEILQKESLMIRFKEESRN